MYKSLFLVAFFCVVALAAPQLRATRQAIEDQLGLPSNATAIRPNIVDSFNCEGRQYGYYADVANDCQLFHVCMPVVYPDDEEEMFKWSFICPEETIFDQVNLVCSRPEDATPCEEAELFYNVNDNFGKTTSPSR